MPRVVAVDAMSGDSGLVAAVAGMQIAIRNDSDLRLIAVGSSQKLKAELKASDRITIEDAEEIVTMDEHPARAARRRKTSMFRAIQMVTEQRAGSAVSAGNTGALMVIAKILLKMRKGYGRPAIGSYLPCQKCSNFFFMLDLGANLDRSSGMLVDFAHMGDERVRASGQISNPRVALLNIGTEQIKGGAEIAEADKLLRQSKLNYVGFTEGNRLFDGEADVVVCDGFTGNALLKALEGLTSMIKGMIVDSYRANLYCRFAGAVSLPVFRALKRSMDHRRYNGAAILGLNGLVVKSHGNADGIAFAAAIDMASRQITTAI